MGYRVNRCEAERPGSPGGEPRPAARAANWVAPPLVLLILWRLPGLGTRPLWFDESFSWRITRLPWGEMVARAAKDVHPPLYYFALKAWTGLFGDSALALRGLSVAWFLAALVGAFLLGAEAAAHGRADGRDGRRAAGDRDACWFATLFLAASPFLFRYSQEARMYTQAAALALIGGWLLLRALREAAQPARWWLAYGLASAALAYTHYFGLFTLAAQGVLVLGLLAVATARGEDRASVRRSARWALASAALVAALYAPWVPVMLRQRGQVVDDYWIRALGRGGAVDPAALRALAIECLVHDKPDQAAPRTWDAASAMPGDALIAAVLGLLAILARRNDRVGGLLALGVAVPVALAIAQSASMNRNLLVYRYFIIPYALVLVGTALAIGRLAIGPVRWLLAAQLTLTLALWNHESLRARDEARGTDALGAADFIAANGRPGDLVVCLRPRDLLPLAYHARGRFAPRLASYPGLVVNHYNGGPLLGDGDLVDWAGLLARRDVRVWLVDNELDRFSPPMAPGPDGWENALARTLRFREPIRFRGDLLLALWRPRGPAPGGPRAPRPSGEPGGETLGGTRP